MILGKLTFNIQTFLPTLNKPLHYLWITPRTVKRKKNVNLILNVWEMIRVKMWRTWYFVNLIFILIPFFISRAAVVVLEKWLDTLKINPQNKLWINFLTNIRIQNINKNFSHTTILFILWKIFKFIILKISYFVCI